eukprot:CAMPEP_0117688436 /NCGR_PEP_ID=MMETSP0804-20121206/23826_1 /TAXON_ID=1074897 /ORGANISM="Tetraselmis astigmatica, Strain CCMP880" /LENGTH=258 /DNA_ID=CAMNT_0005500883 /DNA_START=24 /DNA_END=800 /DNA_ORIENTATION=+
MAMHAFRFQTLSPGAPRLCQRGRPRPASSRPRVQGLQLAAAAGHPTAPNRLPFAPAYGFRSPRSRRGPTPVRTANAVETLEKIKEAGGQGSEEEYNAALVEACASEDWISCIMLLTEARLLRLALQPGILESVALTLSNAGQGQKAAEVLAKHIKAGTSVSCHAISQVMGSLARSADAESAEFLMQAAAPAMDKESSKAYNYLVRTFARADRVEDARKLFDDLFMQDLLRGDTYTAMASMYLRAGQAEEADNMLELRS